MRLFYKIQDYPLTLNVFLLQKAKIGSSLQDYNHKILEEQLFPLETNQFPVKTIATIGKINLQIIFVQNIEVC